MVIGCEIVVPNAIPDDGLLNVKTVDSVFSANASSVTVKLTLPIVCPSKIVIAVLLKV